MAAVCVDSRQQAFGWEWGLNQTFPGWLLVRDVFMCVYVSDTISFSLCSLSDGGMMTDEVLISVSRMSTQSEIFLLSPQLILKKSFTTVVYWEKISDFKRKQTNVRSLSLLNSLGYKMHPEPMIIWLWENTKIKIIYVCLCIPQLGNLYHHY